ncbi:MAG: S8 family serine peptidase, partial [Blastocatellia bacterium]
MNTPKKQRVFQVAIVLALAMVVGSIVRPGLAGKQHVPGLQDTKKTARDQKDKARVRKKPETKSDGKKLKQVPTKDGTNTETKEQEASDQGAVPGSTAGSLAVDQNRELLDRRISEIKAMAVARGSVRVIIGLRVAVRPEATIESADARLAQRAAISRAQDIFLQRIGGYSTTSVKRFETVPFVALEINAEGLEQLRGDQDVLSVREDKIAEPSLSDSVRLIGANNAWASGFSGAGQTIVILDTGVDKNHGFLAGKVVSEACYSTTSASNNSRSFCPGTASESTAPDSGLNCPPGINGCDHGTHVAGIAAGRGANFSGVARDASLISIQVFSRFDNPSICRTANCVRAFTCDFAKGLERALILRDSYNIAAVNMSLGGGMFASACDDGEPLITSLVDNLRAAGIATIIASGNESLTGSLGFPACISSAVSVGSTGDGSAGALLDEVSDYSNSASFLSLLAPGNSITSSVPGGRFANKAGTSMAAPHVAGAWAVLKSHSPGASVSRILSVLGDTGVRVYDSRNGITKPRIQLDAALATLSGGNCRPALSPGSQTFDPAGGNGRVTLGLPGVCSWLATSNTAWIRVSAGASGTGNGVVEYQVDRNAGSSSRTGTLTIAGQTFVVTQSGGAVDPCNTFTPISIGQEISGSLGAGDCQFNDNSYVDFYRFSGNAGQRIAISLTSASFDAYLLLFDSNGDEIAVDDDGGSGVDARIPAGTGFLTLPATGNYIIAANSLSGGETGAYRLRVLVATGTDAPCTVITPISASQQVSGRLESGDCQLADGSSADLYSFTGTAGQRVAISLESTQFDAYLLLRDPGGIIIEQDDDGGGGFNARIPAANGTLVLPVSGTYTIIANSLNAGETGTYTLRLTAPDQNPAPVIASLEPNAAVVGVQGFTLTVNGSGFVNGSVVRWNGSARATTFVSGARLTALIPAADISASGAASVTVFNPAPGGGVSGTLRFDIGASGATDLAIAGQVTPGTAGAGTLITYRFLVTNRGAGTAGRVVVTDNLAVVTTFISCLAEGGGVCGGSGNNRTVTFPVLAPNASTTVTLVAAVNCEVTSGASIGNTATVSAQTPDPDPSNNATTTTVNYTPPQLRLAVGTAFGFGPVNVTRDPVAITSPGTFSLENPGCAPLLASLSVRRTGADVDSGKITGPDDSALFQIRRINPDGSETPVSAAQISGGLRQIFRVVFNPLIPAVAGRTNNLFANQVLVETISSVLTITPNSGLPLSIPLTGRVSTGARLINPLAPRLAPLVALAKSGDEFAVEFSAWDANMDIYHTTFQFLDSAGRAVGQAVGVDLTDSIRQSGLIK